MQAQLTLGGPAVATEGQWLQPPLREEQGDMACMEGEQGEELVLLLVLLAGSEALLELEESASTAIERERERPGLREGEEAERLRA